MALLVASTVGALMILASQAAPDFYTLMLNFTSGGFYLAFLFPLVGALVVKFRGQWQPGPFSFGRGSLLLSVVALVWATFQFLNIAWPRDFYGSWLNWSVWIAVAGLFIVGTGIYLARRGAITSFPTFEVDDPEDDAATRAYLAHEAESGA